MTDDTTPTSDRTGAPPTDTAGDSHQPTAGDDRHWQQETIDAVMERLESELVELQRGANGPQQQALEKGRDIVEDLEAVLRDAAAGEPPDDVPPYEEADAVDVSEQRKRP